jgi:prepilin-type N-terminal cleavage/methylation domain-containing protein
MNYGKGGFTLIELLIALAILTVVATAGFIGLSRYKGGRNVELTMDEIVSVIRDVQKRSITEQDGKQWGIRFSNANSSYEIFSGTSYASGTVDKLYSLSRNIVFGNPATSTIDTIFSAISGKLSENRIISLVNQRKDGLVGNVILLSRGTITSRLEHGVVGYWHLDEATSTKAYDSSGFANTGTLTNSPTWQSASSCKAGECLSFDGTSDYVNVPSASMLNFTSDGVFSISFWVNPTTLASSWRRGIIVQEDYLNSGYRIGFASGGQPMFWTTQSGGSLQLSSSQDLTVSTWNHLVITFDNQQAYIYLNGVQTSSSTGAYVAGSNPIRLGYPVSEWFSGLLDDIRYYNRVLSATEILNLYNDLK